MIIIKIISFMQYEAQYENDKIKWKMAHGKSGIIKDK